MGELNTAVAAGYLEECFAYNRAQKKRFHVSDDWERVYFRGYKLAWDRSAAQYACVGITDAVIDVDPSEYAEQDVA